MWEALRSFKNAHAQTKYFIFMLAIYMLALFWTTFQAYARLQYSRSDIVGPIFIQTQQLDQSTP